MTKTYSSKSNAVRAYLAANPGATRDEALTYVVNDHMGAGKDKWSVVVPEPDTSDADDADVDTDVPVAPILDIKGLGRYKDVPLRRRSTDAGAVSWAWGVFDSMPAGTKRKDAISEAVRQGIAFYTARTQYQRWLRRDDAKTS